MRDSLDRQEKIISLKVLVFLSWECQTEESWRKAAGGEGSFTNRKYFAQGHKAKPAGVRAGWTSRTICMPLSRASLPDSQTGLHIDLTLTLDVQLKTLWIWAASLSSLVGIVIPNASSWNSYKYISWGGCIKCRLQGSPIEDSASAGLGRSLRICLRDFPEDSASAALGRSLRICLFKRFPWRFWLSEQMVHLD